MVSTYRHLNLMEDLQAQQQDATTRYEVAAHLAEDLLEALEATHKGTSPEEAVTEEELIRYRQRFESM